MTISPESAAIGGLLVAVFGLAVGLLACWGRRRAFDDRLDRLEDEVWNLRRESRRHP